jgi:hypothetical protein
MGKNPARRRKLRGMVPTKGQDALKHVITTQFTVIHGIYLGFSRPSCPPTGVMHSKPYLRHISKRKHLPMPATPQHS